LASKLRDYWKGLGQLPPTERWYRKLADDQAGKAAWGDALANIVRAENAGGKLGETRLAGEVLRGKISPSVTDLVRQRAATLIDATSQSFDRSDVVGFLLGAEKWEAGPFLSLASVLQFKTMASYAGTRNLGSADPLDAASIAALAMMRARHGDTKGLDAYAEWIKNAHPAVLEDSVLNALEPFWDFADHPSLREAARATFGNSNSPWGSLDWLLDAQGRVPWVKPLASQLLTITEVRQEVLGGLTNHTYGGESTVIQGGNIETKYANGTGVTYGGGDVSTGLEIGAKFTFRYCDRVAEQLSGIPGFPPINLMWPEAKRDEAVAATAKILQAAGDRLRVREKPPGWNPAFDPPLVELRSENK